MSSDQGKNSANGAAEGAGANGGNGRLKHHCDHYKGARYDHLRRRKFGDVEVDVCIVGAGAAGGVLADSLARAGLDVVVIEAGPFWDPQRDFASDELAMRSLAWQDTRITAGSDPLSLGHNNSGRGVGGGTTHFTGVFLRFHESDFHTYSADGVGVDWPLVYQDLEPYYDWIEKDIGVSGPHHFPWGPFEGPYPLPERNPISANAQVFRKGCEALGIRSVTAPLAIVSAPFDGRPPCINRGFCNQGCMPNSKFSTLIHHIPRAIENGAEVLSDCMVTGLTLDRSEDKVTGVLFHHDGKEYRQKARVVILANFVVETPRLLLNQTTRRFPQGIANSSGWVGKAIMPHSGHDVYVRFEEEIRLYKGTPVLALSQEFYKTDPKRGFARGYTLNAHGARPVEMASGLASAGIWGKKMHDVMLNANFYGRITMVGEVLPNEANAVTLADEKDEYGIARARVSFSYGENDNRMIRHAVEKCRQILEAAGGQGGYVVSDSAHLLGGCRMGDDPSTSVVDADCKSHDLANLYICSGAVFPTSGGGNPTNTIMAVAARTANRLIERMKRGDLEAKSPSPVGEGRG